MNAPEVGSFNFLSKTVLIHVVAFSCNVIIFLMKRELPILVVIPYTLAFINPLHSRGDP